MIDDVAATNLQTFVPADEWESWATDLEIDRWISEGTTMHPYDQAYDDLGIEPEPMRRLPQIHSILYDVSQFKLSERTVEAETLNLRRNGFVVASVSQTFDPMVGHKTEYWGYRLEDME